MKFSAATIAGVVGLAMMAPEAKAQVTWDTFLEVDLLVRDAIVNSQDTEDFPGTLGPNPLGARLVRMSFHDSAGVGGVDAIVDLEGATTPESAAEHAGLAPAVNALNELWNNFNAPAGFSKSDFFAWAYTIAVQASAERQRGNDGPYIPDIPLRYGRPDVDQGTIPAEHFPEMGGHSTGSDIFNYFRANFGFNRHETVVLMGAHTLGGAQGDNSGFVGVWTLQRSVMDENFFARIVGNAVEFATCSEVGTLDDDIFCSGTLQAVASASDCTGVENGCWNMADGLAFYCGSTEESWRCNGWEQRSIRRGTKFQWRHGCDGNGANCRGLMLNADIGLFIDLDDFLCTDDEIDNNECREGEVSPARSPCTDGSGRIFASCFTDKAEGLSDSVVDLSEDVEGWIADFGPVFDRMMLHGTDPSSLEELERPDVLPTVPRGGACPEECYDETTDWTSPVPCERCQNGQCFRPDRRNPPEPACRNPRI